MVLSDCVCLSLCLSTFMTLFCRTFDRSEFLVVCFPGPALVQMNLLLTLAPNSHTDVPPYWDGNMFHKYRK